MELLDESAAWDPCVGESSLLLPTAEHDALASFLIYVETSDLQPPEKEPGKRQRPEECGATDAGAQVPRKRRNKIPTHQRRRDEIRQLNQTLEGLQILYEQTQSERSQSRQTRDGDIENAERALIQNIATNMHLRRSVERAKTKASTLCRLLARMASPCLTLSMISIQRRLPAVFHQSDTEIFRLLEHRLGSKSQEIHRRLLEGEFQLPEATCDLKEACVNPNGSVVDFVTVRILPFGIEMINDITWRCYDELDCAPGMIQLLAEKCGDSMTVKQVFLIERNAEADILLQLRVVCKRFKWKDEYIVTWEGMIDGSLQTEDEQHEVFCAQTRESGWGIARPVEQANDSATILQSFVQVTPSSHKSSIVDALETSESLIDKTVPTYSWVVDKRFQELENRLLDAVVQGIPKKSLVICEVPETGAIVGSCSLQRVASSDRQNYYPVRSSKPFACETDILIERTSQAGQFSRASSGKKDMRRRNRSNPRRDL